MQRKLLQILLKNKLFFLVLLLGTSSWSLVSIRSGIYYQHVGGIGFWGPHGHDAIWHLSIINSLSKFSINLPIYSGITLKSYHFGYDFLIALLHKLTFIPISVLYFQIFPTASSLVIGLLVYYLVFLLTESRKSSLLATIFVYFGGNWAWVLNKGESTFWAQQSISTQINPPFALSLIFLLIGLILLQKNKMLYASLFFGILVQIKIYAGLLILFSLLTIGLWRFIFFKNSNLLKLFSSTFFVSLILTLPFYSSNQVFIFKPFWFLESMMAAVDRLSWQKYAEAMLNYNLAKNYPKLFLSYFVAFLVFTIGNLGTRIVAIKLFLNKKTYKNISDIYIILLLIIIVGTLIPIFFIQSSTPWNTIQFFYYSLFFLSILSGIAIANFNKYLIFLIILLTIPTTFLSLKNYYLTYLPASKISQYELNALKKLKELPEGLVLTYPFDYEEQKFADTRFPRSLYVYDTSSYVSAYSSKNVFFEDEINLSILNIDYNERRQQVLDFFYIFNKEQQIDFLKKNKIKYIYVVTDLYSQNLEYEVLFANDLVKIYNLNTDE